jgi:hypothetical protein
VLPRITTTKPGRCRHERDNAQKRCSCFTVRITLAQPCAGVNKKGVESIDSIRTARRLESSIGSY